MPADEINIPKIALSDNNPDVHSETSVLVPKMENHEEAVTQPTPPSQPQTMEQNQPPEHSEKGNGLLLKISIDFLALILILVVTIGIPTYMTYQKGMVLYKSVKNLEAAAKSQDLTQIKTQLSATSVALDSFKSSYNLLSWTKVLPYAG